MTSKFTLKLSAGEMLFINGAKIIALNSVQLELQNAAQFLLAQHILDESDLVTRTDHMYFYIQECWMGNIDHYKMIFEIDKYIEGNDYEFISKLNDAIRNRHYADALKILRVKRKEERNARSVDTTGDAGRSQNQ